MKKNIFIFVLIIFSLQSCKRSSEDCEQKAGRLIYKVNREFALNLEKNGLSLVGMGRSINHANLKTKSIGIDFQYDKILTLENARKLIVCYMPLYLEVLNKEEDLRECLDVVPFPMSNLSFIIYGKSLPEDDSEHVETVRCDGGFITYYSNNPDINIKRYAHLHEETFEEAERIVAEQAESIQQGQEVPGVVEGEG